jgi:hypothetical protein
VLFSFEEEDEGISAKRYLKGKEKDKTTSYRKKVDTV